MKALHPDHLADLRKSGLTDETITRCQFESVRPKEVPFKQVESAYRLPYFTLMGERDEFERMRLFPPMKGKNGTQKYHQESGTGSRIYAPPLMPWADIAQKTDIPLSITEGEKKSAALCQLGVPSLGVAGVWNWRQRDEEADALILPSLDLVCWVGRTVDIVPDSDVWRSDKESALQGMYALGHALHQRGARVCLVELPEKGQGKIGADDWILSAQGGAKDQWPSLARIPLDSERLLHLAKWYQAWTAREVELNSLKKPQVELHVIDLGGEYAVEFEDALVRMEFLNIESSPRGVQAEFSAYMKGRSLAGITDLNLKSESGKTNLARGLAHYIKDIPWKQHLERACTAVIERVRQGEPIEELQIEQARHVPFILNPLIYEGHQTLLFAPGGSMKSYLALYFSLLLEGGLTDGVLRALKRRVLYLDWELDRETTQARLSLLAAGDQRLNGHHPYYRRCMAPLHIEAAAIAREVRQKNIGCIVIDSAALACGGDLHSPDAPIKLQQAMKKIGCAALVLAHVAKGGEGQDRSTYGSVFFRELARNVVELSRPSLEETEVILSQTGAGCKNSFGRIIDPLGFRIEFHGDKTVIDQFAVEDDPDGAGMEKATHLTRMKSLLSDGQPRTTSNIADTLNIPRGSAKVTLTRNKGIYFQDVGNAKESLWEMVR